MRRQPAIDRRVAALAARQGGVVARAQLRAVGLGGAAIDHRVRGGRLHLVHRGVYAVGHRLVGERGRWFAAVLAAGPGAVVSHGSAAAARDLRAERGVAVHVTVPPASGRRARRGLRVHRAALHPEEVTVHRGLALTSPERTILDLAARVRGRPLEALLDRAELLRLVDFDRLRRQAAERAGRPGAATVCALLERYRAGAAMTRSELEERFLALIDRHALPRPAVNARVERLMVDFSWRGDRLVVEVDGYAHHRSPSAFERDRKRDVRLVLAGWRVLRFTWLQLTESPRDVALSVGTALGTSMAD